ncbi:DEAD/DEAH box helicase [Flexistipes sp.]|uniref:DEAD/DEAH box helicase n=1 Tax=Flexistipes sp. TaxID=3088135 RepID=UPI002E24B523|nr:DEAD/DEAH box helicase [Flexistipes sp.]
MDYLEKNKINFFFYNGQLDWYWFPTDYVRQGDTPFGYVVGQFSEFGHFSLNEIFSVGMTVGGVYKTPRSLKEVVNIVENGGILEGAADISLEKFREVTKSKKTLQNFLDSLPEDPDDPNGSGPGGGEPEKKEDDNLTLTDFLNEFGDTLKEKAVSKLKPVYNPAQIGEWEKQENSKLNKLIRKPFNSQRHAILALAKGFYKEKKKSLILTAEMGTGKTIMSVCVAYLNPRQNKRTLVVCPPHLARKWVREIKETIPGAKVKTLDKVSDVDTDKPQGMEFWVLKNTKAKLHYKEKSLVKWDEETLRAKKCPDCGVLLASENIEDEKNNSATCTNCGTPLYQADREGFRRYGLAEYIKRQKVKVDFLILDEVHELKGGDTAVGQAMANLVSCADKTLAMTGTLMGGYAKNLFYILFRMFTKRFIEKGYAHNSVTSFERNYGVIEETRIYVRESGRNSSIGKKLKSVRIHSKPGMSPALLPEFILDSTYFMKLSDVSDQLPKYNEDIISVPMENTQKEIYKEFENELTSEVKQALARGSNKLLGALVNSLYSLPDGARRGEIVYDPYTYNPQTQEGEVIAYAEPYDQYMLPKERKLIDKILEEKQENRKCAVFLEHTGTRNLVPDLVERLEAQGINALVLKTGSPATDKREAWIKKKLKENPDTDVLICNPNLVKTGLDLLDFPTIIFFQTGYNIYTLRQASRRSWRIGQDKPVRVYYMAYAETMQEQAMKLIASKLETSLAVEGDLSDQGLSSMSEGESMAIQMAKELVGDKKTEDRSLGDVFSSYREKDAVADFDLDETFEIADLTETATEVKEIKTSKGRTRTIESTVHKIITNLEPKKHTVGKGKKKGEVEMVSVFDMLEALDSEDAA